VATRTGDGTASEAFVTRLTKARKIYILGFGNSGIAEHTLFAPCDHPVLTSSNIAVLALIEGLVAGVMARNKEAIKLATKLTESVMSYLHIPASGKAGKK
jgi:DNA-binding MurR/RpiR family transcriptional regulator